MSALKKIEEKHRAIERQVMAANHPAMLALSEDVVKLARALDHALEWLHEEGCDCGISELGTCGLCVAERTLEEVAG